MIKIRNIAVFKLLNLAFNQLFVKRFIFIKNIENNLFLLFGLQIIRIAQSHIELAVNLRRTQKNPVRIRLGKVFFNMLKHFRLIFQQKAGAFIESAQKIIQEIHRIHGFVFFI